MRYGQFLTTVCMVICGVAAYWAAADGARVFAAVFLAGAILSLADLITSK